ncbi:MAG: FolC bifunctional protein [Myxococcales bacterium]|nr:FolC bifunctional protein [Myxococcales bacterium]
MSSKFRQQTEYRDLLARLLSARRFGIKLGLDRMRELLDRLGSPDRQLGTVVHVGGTNGKGSTVAMIAKLAGNARVATYTSPHLSSLRERIVIDGAMISEAAIVAAAERVEEAGGGELTFFEQITAIAMIAIAEANVDVTVLEVGLGGRLDATNVVAAPIAVVTGVAMDHEAILGDSLEAIAAEKAGIWKPGQRAIIGASGEPAAVPFLVERAREAGVAELTVIGRAEIDRVPHVALPGEHQRANAATALAVLDQLQALGVVAAVDRAAALAAVHHPGRFEVIGDVILDGAHNPHGARALAETLRQRGERPVLVIAVSSDKDVRAIASVLAPVASAVIATRYQQDRAMDPAALAAVFREVAPGLAIETAPDLASALAIAPRPALIAGSLFIVGEARVLLAGAAADPMLVSDPSTRTT